MGIVGTRAWLRPAGVEDEGFLFDVFSTTWQHAVAAMPNPDLVRHFLRIQYTAQNRRFAARFNDHERAVVMHGGRPIGRVYLHRSEAVVTVIDMSLLPEHHSQGIGRSLLRDILEDAGQRGQAVALRVARRNTRAMSLYEAEGFRLSTMDDLDAYFEWTPPAA